MQIVSQKVSTHRSTVPIIDPEKRTFRPALRFIILRLWLHDIKYNGYSIFIIVSNNTLVGVGTISCDQPIPLVGKLSV